MATVVYQGFQSHFESQHFEPRALRLRLNPLKSHFLDSSITPQDNTTSNAASLSSPNSGSLSFLETISNSSSDDTEKKKVLPYVHSPSSRRTLSDESLALCTESLGSETGSDVMNDQDLLLLSSELQSGEARASTTSSRLSRQDRKRNAIASLPPPLKSMRSVDSIQVKSHRENGRLVMMATRAPPRDRCVQDRSNGCVRLAILVDSDESETKEEEERIETEIAEEEIQEIEVQRSRRCGEGDVEENRGLLNWESFCVATS